MGTISLQIPQANLPNSTEDAKVASDLTTLQTLVNGNIDHNNINASAGILFSQIQNSSWIALSLTTNVGVAAGYYTPSSRLQGDTVQLKGTLVNNTGSSFPSGGDIALLDSTCRPAALVSVPLNQGFWAIIKTDGHIELQSGLPSSASMSFDGVTFTIS